jgi:hypothetical protein
MINHLIITREKDGRGMEEETSKQKNYLGHSKSKEPIEN